MHAAPRAEQDLLRISKFECRLILAPRTSTATDAPRHEPLELLEARHRRVAVLLFQEITQVARIFSYSVTPFSVPDQSGFQSNNSKILI